MWINAVQKAGQIFRKLYFILLKRYESNAITN